MFVLLWDLQRLLWSFVYPQQQIVIWSMPRTCQNINDNKEDLFSDWNAAMFDLKRSQSVTHSSSTFFKKINNLIVAEVRSSNVLRRKLLFVLQKFEFRGQIDFSFVSLFPFIYFADISTVFIFRRPNFRSITWNMQFVCFNKRNTTKNPLNICTISSFWDFSSIAL